MEIELPTVLGFPSSKVSAQSADVPPTSLGLTPLEVPLDGPALRQLFDMAGIRATSAFLAYGRHVSAINWTMTSWLVTGSHRRKGV
jgi:hypothetical protein